MLVSHSVAVSLPLQTVLHEANIAPGFAHFLRSGIASVVVSMTGGETAELFKLPFDHRKGYGNAFCRAHSSSSLIVSSSRLHEAEARLARWLTARGPVRRLNRAVFLTI
jgi:hypothetical protein